MAVVNDNRAFLEMMGDILTDERHAVSLIDGDQADAIQRVREAEPDLLIIDLRMGGGQLHGWDIAQEVRRDIELEELPILVCSADTHAIDTVAAELSTTRNIETLTKPFGLDDLMTAIDGLLTNPSSADGAPEPVGGSPTDRRPGADR